jgi:predicted dienelactone hydrolase
MLELPDKTLHTKHLRMAIDSFFVSKGISGRGTPTAVSVISYSLGGYTSLAAAGGIPTSFLHESSDGQERVIEAVPDPRIQSLVLLAPATVWFRVEGALRSVNLPMLMLDAEKDPYTPPFHAQIVLGGVADPKKVHYEIIECRALFFSWLVSSIDGNPVISSFPRSTGIRSRTIS